MRITSLVFLFLWAAIPAAAQERQFSVQSKLTNVEATTFARSSKLAPALRAVIDTQGKFIGVREVGGKPAAIISTDRPVMAPALRLSYSIQTFAPAKSAVKNLVEPKASLKITYEDRATKPTDEQLKAAGLKRARKDLEFGNRGVIYVETIGSGLDAKGCKVLESLNIRYAQPNYPASLIKPIKPNGDTTQPPNQKDASPASAAATELTPTDQFWPDLWGMRNINAPFGWAVHNDASDIVVAVVDTGIFKNHVDLRDNLWTNPGEIPNDGIDNDGNGFIDDVHGFDFVRGDGNPDDLDGHGSHVAGTIGAFGNGPQNSAGQNRGVVGVCWRTKIMSLKALPASQELFITNFTMEDCVKYAVTNNANIISNSWTSFTNFDDALFIAIQFARDNGVLYVAASANENNDNDTNPFFPSSYDVENVIAVGSLDENDMRSGFSNFGATSVDIFAPGGNIISAWPGDSQAPEGRVNTISGTSMACPHVSGACALVWSAMGSTANWQNVRDRIYNTARNNPNLNGLAVNNRALDLGAALLGVTPPSPDEIRDTDSLEGIIANMEEKLTGLENDMAFLKVELAELRATAEQSNVIRTQPSSMALPTAGDTGQVESIPTFSVDRSTRNK